MAGLPQTVEGRTDLLASTEMVTVQMDLYCGALSRCWDACITNYFEKDLALGEGVCVDRCITKYVLVNRRVNKDTLGVTGALQLDEQYRRVRKLMRLQGSEQEERS